MPIIDPIPSIGIDAVRYPQRASYNGCMYAFASLETLQRHQRNPDLHADPSQAIDNQEE